MEVAEVREGLESFITDTFGSDARIENLIESDGHAGLTFLFEVATRAGSTPYVIKLPPKGVTRKGNTDVYRQAPLLRALYDAGLPVPNVPWAYDENDWFEIPFIVMERLAGKTFFVWDPAPGLPRDTATARGYYEQCAVWLARIHHFDWKHSLADWETPIDLEKDIARWERVYRQAPEADWIRRVEHLRAHLIDSRPEPIDIGLFHGDYQPGNCLYVDQTLTGIIDWELSGIGPQLIDVGWLCMVADGATWTDSWKPHGAPPITELLAIYRSESGRNIDNVGWYHAYCAYRLAAITCLNVKLHRSGQRHDPMWEHNGRSLVTMCESAERHLDA